MAFKLRDYQIEATQAGVKFLKSDADYNAIEVLPTGSGKSLVIANIVGALHAPTLVFQPSKEILEQNWKKMTQGYGYPASIFSASFKSKLISNITFATIGSVISKPNLFREFKYIIIDECHLVNSKKGMYRDFLKILDHTRVLGLTATPYRLNTDGFGGSMLKFLTRTRPRIFKEMIYFVDNDILFGQGYLAKLQYYSIKGYERKKLRINSTGANFTDASMKIYGKQINFAAKIAGIVKRLVAAGRKNILVFTTFVEEAQELTSLVPNCAIVSAKTPGKDRAKIINDFRNGRIRVVANVGILTTGFDYPELDTVVLARPTRSLGLYYQMIGRGIRPHPSKDRTMIIDMCGNVPVFGRIETFKIKDGGNGKWYLSNGQRQLTNVYFE